MSGALHDVVVLSGMAVFDAAVVAVWWFLCSRFMPRDDVITAPLDGDVVRRAAPSALHRALGVICLALLIGLIVECSGSAVWYVLRYGFTR